MKKSMEITSDGINIYTTLNVKSKLTGKIILSAMVLILFAFFVAVVSSLKEPGDAVLLFLLFLALLFFPVRFLLWNLFGKEQFIINTKSISYLYDYGILRTNLKTVNFDKLGIDFNKVRIEKEHQYGNITFYNYRADNHLPEEIFQTTVLMDTKSKAEIEKRVFELFEGENREKFNFIGFSKNQ
jgi:hypothetical protein